MPQSLVLRHRGTGVRLREAFCNEVLSQLADHWRLRRCVILRWAHSWYLHHAPEAMPLVLRQPISAPW